MERLKLTCAVIVCGVCEVTVVVVVMVIGEESAYIVELPMVNSAKRQLTLFEPLCLSLCEDSLTGLLPLESFTTDMNDSLCKGDGLTRRQEFYYKVKVEGKESVIVECRWCCRLAILLFLFFYLLFTTKYYYCILYNKL